MKSRMHGIAMALLTIALGAAWLLNAMNILPGVNWLWTSLLGVAGLLVLGVGGINRLTVVVGPFLIITSIFSILRQSGRIDVNHEVPMLVIVLGVLMLIAQLAPLREAGAPPPPQTQKRMDA